MPGRKVRPNLDWADDTALLAGNRSADPAAETKGARQRPRVFLSNVPKLRAEKTGASDRHQSGKPSRQDAATVPAGSVLAFANAPPPEFQFTLNHCTVRSRRILQALVVATTWIAAAICTLAPLANDKTHIVASFAINSDGDWPIVPVQIGDTTQLFLFDTGCAPTSLDTSFKQLLGPVRRKGVSVTSRAQVEEELFSAPSAALGRVSLLTDSLVSLTELRPFREFTGHEIKGILGNQILSRYIVQFDFDAGELRLFDELDNPPGIQLALQLNELRLPIIIGEIPDIGRVPFAIDTGFIGDSGNLSADVFDELRKLGHIKNLRNCVQTSAAGKVVTYSGALEKLVLGDGSHRDLEFSGGGSMNILGLGVLSRYVVTLDLSKGKLFLARGKRFAAPEMRNRSGLKLLRVHDETIVHNVTPAGAGDQAGIRKGDILLRVGSFPASTLRMFAIRKILSDEGNTIELAIKRGDEIFAVRLRLKEPRRRIKHTFRAND